LLQPNDAVITSAAASAPATPRFTAEVAVNVVGAAKRVLPCGEIAKAALAGLGQTDHAR